ncbi:hypothetical protein ACHQM5_022583 [Ranunculus cassubicifolius]
MAEAVGNEEIVSSSINRVKFLCSHGGKILPRPPDGQLKYVGGETRVIAVPRDTNFSELKKKLSSLVDGQVVLKYQVLPEDLDTLISVTCDEDLQNMLAENDRQGKRSSSSENGTCPMLRAFLFPSSATNVDHEVNPETMDNQALEQHYIDAINGVLRTPITLKRRPSGFSPKSIHDGYTFDSINHDIYVPTPYHIRTKEIPRVNSSPSLYDLGRQSPYYHPAHNHPYHPSTGFHVQYSNGSGHHLAPAMSAGRNDFGRYQMGYPHQPPRYYSPTTPSTPGRGSGHGCNGCGHEDDIRVYRSGGLEMVVPHHGSLGP